MFEIDTIAFALKSLVAAASLWAVLAFVVQNWSTPKYAEGRSFSLNSFRVWLKGDWSLTIMSETHQVNNAEVAKAYLSIWVLAGLVSYWPAGLVSGMMCLLAARRQQLVAEQIRQAIRA